MFNITPILVEVMKGVSEKKRNTRKNNKPSRRPKKFEGFPVRTIKDPLALRFYRSRFRDGKIEVHPSLRGKKLEERLKYEAALVELQRGYWFLRPRWHIKLLYLALILYPIAFSVWILPFFFYEAITLGSEAMARHKAEQGFEGRLARDLLIFFIVLSAMILSKALYIQLGGI